ncbi:hypothetical protein, partial [Eikenella sp. NML080894]|uniref:hypothetical protein n=1 Tax=Eikenella sp. NML080894 TaxID=1795830 RepID=UPI001E61D86E
VSLVRIAAEWAAGFNYRSQARLTVFPEGVVFLRIDPPEKLGVQGESNETDRHKKCALTGQISACDLVVRSS